MPFDMHSTSGTTFQWSMQNMVPVRQKPHMTSSAIMATSYLVQISRISGQYVVGRHEEARGAQFGLGDEGRHVLGTLGLDDGLEEARAAHVARRVLKAERRSGSSSRRGS